MKYKYSFKTDKENVVKVVGRDLALSFKQSIEICSFIRGKPIAKVKAMLEKVKEKKLAVPFRRFTEGAGHKKSISGGGKYPLKGSEGFIALLDSLEANAQSKGLSSNLRIIHACAQKAARPYHNGRKRRVKMKRVHIEIAAQEIESGKDSKKTAERKQKGQDSKGAMKEPAQEKA